MVYGFLRLLAAILTLAAIGAQLQRSVSIALKSETDYGSSIPTVVSNFLSFFTIQSNLATAIVLIIAFIWAFTRGKDAEQEPAGLAVALVCVSTYMIITGIVYNTLLRGIPLQPGATVEWSNEVMHVVMPLFMLIDLLFAPKRRALPWSRVWIVVIYPIVWVIYTLVRGPFITSPFDGAPFWYPYPFLNPNNPDLVPPGYAGVAVYVVGIAAGIIVVGLFAVWVGRYRAGRRTERIAVAQ